MQSIKFAKYLMYNKNLNMKNLIILGFIITLYACGNQSSSSTSTSTGDLSGYTMTSLGSGGEQAIKYSSGNSILEEGYLVDGKRNGMWMTYHDDNHRIKTITHYINNELNGPFMEFNNRGQIESKAGYLNGQYHGKMAKYKFGRPTVETDYKNGEIDGKHIEYFNNGKKQKQVEFKNGKQDGKLTYYDEEENVTLEYTYVNGEKQE